MASAPCFAVVHRLVVSVPAHPSAAEEGEATSELLDQLRRGDQIVTSGGIIGKVRKVVADTELQVEIAEDVRVRVARGMVSEVLTRQSSQPRSSSNVFFFFKKKGFWRRTWLKLTVTLLAFVVTSDGEEAGSSLLNK